MGSQDPTYKSMVGAKKKKAKAPQTLRFQMAEKLEINIKIKNLNEVYYICKIGLEASYAK